MNRTIWKYNLPFQERGSVKIPYGYRILHFGTQFAMPTIWVEVDPTQSLDDMEYAIFGTGWDIPDDSWGYVGSWMDGGFVWHVYRRY